MANRFARRPQLLGAMIAIAALSLTSCGGDDAGNGSKVSGVNLVKNGTLTTCTHLPYAPFQSKKGSEVVGFDVDLIDLVAKELGVKQEIIDTPFEGIKSGQDLNTGKCDIAAAGMTITDERKKVIDFSKPYFDATQALLVKKGAGLKALDRFQGQEARRAGRHHGQGLRRQAEAARRQGHRVRRPCDRAAGAVHRPDRRRRQ